MDYSHCVGLSFGLLVVTRVTEISDKMICMCACGNEKVVALRHLRSGSVKSCSCLLKTRPGEVHQTHGKSSTKEYRIWSEMLRRCTSANHPAFSYYGGRGITVCKEWSGGDGHIAFLSDMGARPSGMSVDRIDNELGYSKENCRWATQKEQSNNRRSNHLISAFGKTQTIAGWSADLGIAEGTISERIRRGWNEVEAISKPTRLQMRNRDSRQLD